MPKTKGKQKKDLKQKPQSNGSGLFVWIAMAFFVILTLSILPNDTENEIEISYNSYQQLLSAGKIEKATIEQDNSFHGILSESMVLDKLVVKLCSLVASNCFLDIYDSKNAEQ